MKKIPAHQQFHNPNREQRRRWGARERLFLREMQAERQRWIDGGCREPSPRFSFDPEKGYRIDRRDGRPALTFPLLKVAAQKVPPNKAGNPQTTVSGSGRAGLAKRRPDRLEIPVNDNGARSSQLGRRYLLRMEQSRLIHHQKIIRI